MLSKIASNMLSGMLMMIDENDDDDVGDVSYDGNAVLVLLSETHPCPRQHTYIHWIAPLGSAATTLNRLVVLPVLNDAGGDDGDD